jgi:hypothetical protein
MNVAFSGEDILMWYSVHHNCRCSSRFYWGLICRGMFFFVCYLSPYNLFPELLSNENPPTERVIVCDDFISNSVVFIPVFYATSVLIITKSKKKLITVPLWIFHRTFVFGVLLHNVLEQIRSWLCRQTDLTIALYVHHIKIHRSTLSPIYCGEIEYEFQMQTFHEVRRLPTCHKLTYAEFWNNKNPFQEIHLLSLTGWYPDQSETILSKHFIS